MDRKTVPKKNHFTAQNAKKMINKKLTSRFRVEQSLFAEVLSFKSKVLNCRNKREEGEEGEYRISLFVFKKQNIQDAQQTEGKINDHAPWRPFPLRHGGRHPLE
jgi:hypothetical protein